MKEKIEWYKEVLELEPGSRIFFPLAKLLAEDGQTDDAVVTLRQGLAKHPDHVEARLMLVELLSRQQSMTAVRREMDDLSSLFSAYPGFWQAWSEHLAKNPDMRDASVAMRFFSESMQGRKLDWSAVIEAGLKALLFDAPDAMDAMDAPDATETPQVQPAQAGKDAASTDKKPSLSIEVKPSPTKSTAQGNHVPAQPPAREAKGEAETEPTLPAAAPLRVVSAKLKKQPHKKGGAAEAAAPAPEEADAENNEEAFSLRTRTMADILADQGDYAAAAEIYQELAGKASAEDQKELLARFAELTARAGESPAPAPAREDDDDSGLDSAEGSKLVDLLESLAERLEERSR